MPAVLSCQLRSTSLDETALATAFVGAAAGTTVVRPAVGVPADDPAELKARMRYRKERPRSALGMVSVKLVVSAGRKARGSNSNPAAEHFSISKPSSLLELSVQVS